MHNELRSLLHELTSIPGISGHEDQIARTLAAQLRLYSDEVTIDALGNVIARQGSGTGRKIAICAHIDTVGLMIKRKITEGMFGITRIGGVNLKAMPGTRVIVGEQAGVIGVRSQHQAQANDAAVTSDEDLHVLVAADAEIEITTPVHYAPQFTELSDNMLVSPYLDNRAGCAVLLETARRLPESSPQTVYFIGTTQEETTCAGAMSVLQRVQPDACLFVDGTVSYDTPDTRGKGSVALGQGPVLTSFLYVSGLNGWHADPLLRSYLKQVAIEAGIEYQQDAIHGLMSDSRVAGWLGLSSVIIGVPMRGKHSAAEVCNLNDLEQAIKLLLAVLSTPLPTLQRG
ncbi:MAG: M20/M25/M40 family metallo-hydrolase [Anaerolineae bacterium]